MSNLDYDIAMAQKLGYGVWYGRYKADHPYTKDEEQEEIVYDKGVGACEYCGRLFRKDRGMRRRFCNDQCRYQYRKQEQLQEENK